MLKHTESQYYRTALETDIIRNKCPKSSKVINSGFGHKISRSTENNTTQTLKVKLYKYRNKYNPLVAQANNKVTKIQC